MNKQNFVILNPRELGLYVITANITYPNITHIYSMHRSLCLQMCQELLFIFSLGKSCPLRLCFCYLIEPKMYCCL